MLPPSRPCRARARPHSAHAHVAGKKTAWNPAPPARKHTREQWYLRTTAANLQFSCHSGRDTQLRSRHDWRASASLGALEPSQPPARLCKTGVIRLCACLRLCSGGYRGHLRLALLEHARLAAAAAQPPAAGTMDWTAVQFVGNLEVSAATPLVLLVQTTQTPAPATLMDLPVPFSLAHVAVPVSVRRKGDRSARALPERRRERSPRRAHWLESRAAPDSECVGSRRSMLPCADKRGLLYYLLL